jgi:hypothetical protein
LGVDLNKWIFNKTGEYKNNIWTRISIT